MRDFAPQTVNYGGHAPSALAAGDFTGDGRIDLAVTDEDDNQVSVLMNLGGGAFAVGWSFDIGEDADYLQVLYDPDGYNGVALAATSADSQNGIVLLLGGDGSVASTLTVPLGGQPIGQAIGEFNDDGFTDIALVTASSPQVVVRLGNSGNQVLDPGDAAPLPQSPPVVVDWNGDGTPDVFTLDQQGQLLLRLGQPGSPGEFESPQVIGQNLGVSFSDIALVQTGYGPVLAALEAGQPVVWLFSHAQGPGATIEARSIPVPGATFLVSMTAGDLEQRRPG